MLQRLQGKDSQAGSPVADEATGSTPYGAKYDPDLTTAQIVGLLRVEIYLARELDNETASEGGKALRDAPREIEITVHGEEVRSGAIIDVAIRNIPKDWGWEAKPHPRSPGKTLDRPSPALQALAEELATRMLAYKNGDSPRARDVNFIGSVCVNGSEVLAMA
ncbi:hypothetical protein ACPB8P_05155 [Streptomyces cellulosae]